MVSDPDLLSEEEDSCNSDIKSSFVLTCEMKISIFINITDGGSCLATV